MTKYEAGARDEDVQAADLLQEYKARIAALERTVGGQAQSFKGELSHRPQPRSGAIICDCRSVGLSVSRGWELMGLARSTFYDAPGEPVDDADLVARMAAICDVLACYGYRPIGAALRQQGTVVNSKKVRRLMREHRLQPNYSRRYVTDTDCESVGAAWSA
jgi:hypothetical protein